MQPSPGGSPGSLPSVPPASGDQFPETQKYKTKLTKLKLPNRNHQATHTKSTITTPNYQTKLHNQHTKHNIPNQHYQIKLQNTLTKPNYNTNILTPQIQTKQITKLNYNTNIPNQTRKTNTAKPNYKTKSPNTNHNIINNTKPHYTTKSSNQTTTPKIPNQIWSTPFGSSMCIDCFGAPSSDAQPAPKRACGNEVL